MCKRLVFIGIAIFFWVYLVRYVYSIEEGTGYLPNFNPEKKLERLSQSLSKSEPLLTTLGEASKKLCELMKEYTKNPSYELLSQIEEEFSRYSGKILTQLETFLGEKDSMKWVMKELRRDVEGVQKSLNQRAEEIMNIMNKKIEEGKAIREELRDIAIRIKSGEGDKEALKREFKEKLRRLQILDFQVRGYKVHKKNFTQLSNNMGKLMELFTSLEGQLLGLMESLESQKEMLAFTIKTRQDTAKVVRGVYGGIGNGSKSLKAIAEKATSLSQKLKNFAKINEILTNDINSFLSLNHGIEEIMGKINDNGMIAFVTDEKMLSKYIDYFAKDTSAGDGSNTNNTESKSSNVKKDN